MPHRDSAAILIEREGHTMYSLRYGSLLAAGLGLAFHASLAAAAVQIDFTGTTAHSTIVANGLPVTGYLSFDPAAAIQAYAYSSAGVNTVGYSVPGSAEFAVDGQTYDYNLSSILLNDAGIVLFRFTETTDPMNALYLIRGTSNTDISVIPGANVLDGFGVFSAQFPDGSDSIIFADLQLGNSVPEPATWAMMLLGFGAVGYSIRRKGDRVPAVA